MILVAVTVDDAGLDLAADAALGADGAAAQLGGQDPAFGADVARPFEPAEGVNGRAAVDHHRAIAGVGQYVRVDARRGVHA